MKKAVVAGFLFATLAGLVRAAELSDYAHQGWDAFFPELLRSLDVAGFLLLTLLAVAVGMAIDVFCSVRVSRMIPERLLLGVQEQMASGEYEKALEICRENDCLAGRIFAAALEKADHSFERMQGAMRAEADVLGLVWRQLVGQFRLTALGGTLFGLLGAFANLLRLVSHLQGRPNLGMALAASFEMRSLLYGVFGSLFLGVFIAGASRFAYHVAKAKLERILLECDRLGEEILDPFRPLPAQEE
ncbi:MAG: hypothetical protein LBT97_10580 [Planctomycetota bacterium]|jgi:hypothetical protein|nr:hypothetical protein [Planctomycetota bacterium]